MDNNELLSKKRIAEIFGLSIRSVEKLVEGGTIEAVGSPMKFEWKAVTDYIKHLSEKAQGREVSKTTAENEAAKIEAEARLKRAKAEMAELSLEELKGNLHRSDDVQEIMTAHIYAVRSMLMALPGRLALDVTKTVTAPESSEIIKKEVYRMLEELTDFVYSKDEYLKRIRERQGWDDEETEA